jgi:hypothetical protein
MLPNAFIGKPEKPTGKELAVALGSAKTLWDELLTMLGEQFDTGTHEWNSYSPKAGWSLKVKQGSRTILYMSPCRGSFRVSFALGDKAVKAALGSDLSRGVVKMIKEAKRYAEGTAVRIDVKAAADLGVICKIAACKLEN